MLLAEIVNHLNEAWRELEKVFGSEFKGLALFGSWARGEAKEDSDVNAFIVFETLRSLDARIKAYNTLSRYDKKPFNSSNSYN